MLDVLKFYDSTGNGRQKYLSFSSSGEARSLIQTFSSFSYLQGVTNLYHVVKFKLDNRLRHVCLYKLIIA